MVYINIPVDTKLMLPLNSGGFTISGGLACISSQCQIQKQCIVKRN
jgi:hypothetical protein